MLQTIPRADLMDRVMKGSPLFGWDISYPTLFGKYGKTVTGICDEWIWYTSDSITAADRGQGKCPVSEASTEELLEMLAIEESYWSRYYQDRCQVVEAKAAKLDRFIGTCATKYFGHDSEYSEHSIDRVIEFVYAILARDYYERK